MQNLKNIYYSLFLVLTLILSSFAQPNISISPQSFDVELNSGKIIQKILTLTNSGSEDLYFSISVNIPGSSACKNFAMQFDGLDDHVLIKDSKSLDISEHITIEAWVNLNADHSGSSPTMLRKEGNFLLELGDAGNNIPAFIIWCPGIAELDGPVIPKFEWHHWAGTYDGKTLKLYIDGHEVSSYPIEATISTSDEVLYFGNYWGEWFQGLLDEVRIWNMARTQAEIQSDMNIELSGYEEGLIGYWNFNEGSGDYAFDQSINNNHGILQNGPEWISSTIPTFPSWLNIDLKCDTISSGSDLNMAITFDATGLIGGDYSTDIFISSNDPDQPEIKFPVYLNVTDAPSFSANLDTLDFGQVFLGDSSVLDLIVTNSGSQDLLIPSIQIIPSQYNVLTDYASIDPLETEVFTVKFYPQTEGLYPGTITFNSNDPDHPAYEVVLHGQGVRPPIIEVSPESLNISVKVGEPMSKKITIMNNGYSDLKFDIMPGSYSENFALRFDGINDLVRVPETDFLDLSSEITIEAWIKPFTTEGPRVIVGKWNEFGPFGLDFSYLFLIHEDLDVLRVYLSDRNVWPFYGDLADLEGKQAIETSKWTHIATTFDSKNVKILIDGEEDNSKLAQGSIRNSEADFIIGSQSDQYYFSGLMDEIRIWNHARTQDQIIRYMYYELTGSEPGLVGYWNFNEGSGQYTYDQSQNNNHGTLQEGPEWVESDVPVIKWISYNPPNGICSPSSSIDITINFETTEIDTGHYRCSLLITSNDPIRPQVNIPIIVQILTTGLEQETIFRLPREFALYQNYPNPFNPSTMINYQLPMTTDIELSIYNLLGQKVVILVSENQKAGYHQVEWDASGFASGVYYYRIEAGKFQDVKKMVLLR